MSQKAYLFVGGPYHGEVRQLDGFVSEVRYVLQPQIGDIVEPFWWIKHRSYFPQRYKSADHQYVTIYLHEGTHPAEAHPLLFDEKGNLRPPQPFSEPPILRKVQGVY